MPYLSLSKYVYLLLGKHFFANNLLVNQIYKYTGPDQHSLQSTAVVRIWFGDSCAKLCAFNKLIHQ